MNLLDPQYNESEKAQIEEIRSQLNVARAIIAHRIANGMSQEALGKAAGTKQSRISEIESLKGNPRLNTLDRIALALGLMIDLVPRKVAKTWRAQPVYRQVYTALDAQIAERTSVKGAIREPMRKVEYANG